MTQLDENLKVLMVGKEKLINHLHTNSKFVNLVEQMNLTSQPIPANESEFELAGLTPIASSLVKPPRVKECKITMECEMVHHYKLENSKTGGATIVIGKIVPFSTPIKYLLPLTSAPTEQTYFRFFVKSNLTAAFWTLILLGDNLKAVSTISGRFVSFAS